MARVALETLRVSLPTILEEAYTGVSSRSCDDRLQSWSRRLLAVADIRLKVSGRQYLQPGEPYVVMSNHQSHYDIPVLFQALRIPMRMVAKRELFRIPFMGRAMGVAGFVPIDRKHAAKSMEVLLGARAHLGNATSIWIAPEGTRSRSGHLGPFKRGGFYMALKTGMRILPVTIEGTRQVLSPGSLSVRLGQQVRIAINPPIDTAIYGMEQMNQLIHRVRTTIENEMGVPSLQITGVLQSVAEAKWAS